MTEKTNDFRFSLLTLWAAGFLVLVYLVGFTLSYLGVWSLSRYVRPDLLFWTVIVIAGLALLSRFGHVVPDRIRTYRVEDSLAHDHSRILTAATRNLVLLFVLLVVASYFEKTVSLYLDLSLLSLVVLAVLVTTLLVSEDRNTRIATNAGSASIVVLLWFAQFVDPLRASVDNGTYVLAGVLLGTTLYKERERIRAREAVSWRLGTRVTRLWFFLLLGLAAVLYLNRLGALHLQGDEHQVVAAAAGYYFTGEFHLWNWITSEPRPIIYDRAWPHTLLIAGSYAIFGISEWSSRLPSALAGIATVPVSYFVFQYFTERRVVALLTSSALVLYPVLINFFRWTRMYAILIPIFLVLTYLVYRTLTEEYPFDFRNDTVGAYIERYFDFDFRFGALTLVVLYFGYQIHLNTLFILPTTYLFVLYLAIVERTMKYVIPAVIGTVGLYVMALLVRYTDLLNSLTHFLSFFARRNTAYVDHLFQFPFQTLFSVLFFVGGFVVIQLLRDERVRRKLTFLYILTVFSLGFLVFIGDRYASFAYIIHIVPVALALIVFGFSEIVMAYRSRIVRLLLLGLFVFSVVPALFVGANGVDYSTLYVEDDEDFRTAYGTILRNYEEDQAIFVQYPRRYYLRPLGDNATIVNMESDRTYLPSEFTHDLKKYESGWITWETGKTYHINNAVRRYIDENFVKYHGKRVDDTGVEVYYFNESMVKRNATTLTTNE